MNQHADISSISGKSIPQKGIQLMTPDGGASSRRTPAQNADGSNMSHDRIT